jgi:RNA polymerase sigma-70 factor (ECF subfamily)
MGCSVSAAVKKQFIAAIPTLRAFARSLCGNAVRADDLVQETLMKALAKIDSFQEGSNAQAWLITILRNHYFSEGRKRRREVEDGEGHYAATLSTPGRQLDTLEVKDLMTALQMIADDKREALLLVTASGYSYEEAAQIMGTKPGTVKSRVSRARAELETLMNGSVELSSHSKLQDRSAQQIVAAFNRGAAA